MPRPRKIDSHLSGIIETFARELARGLRGFIDERVGAASRSTARGKGGKGRSGGRRRGARAGRLCYYPGCKNIAAPRFGMFCAQLHKNISKAAKNKYRAAKGKAALS